MGKEANQMFDILYPVLCDHYNFGECNMDIVRILADYSLGIAVQCSNTTKKCKNEIFYDSQFRLELDLRKITEDVTPVSMYQYVPKYIFDEGTHKIYGKNRRIFCEDCTKNEVKDCVSCCDAMD